MPTDRRSICSRPTSRALPRVPVYDACAAAWPPLLTEDEPEVGEQANPALLDTFERQDGGTQVTYNGWPLYYYAQDQGPAEATGQDVHGFGGEWYLVTPEGNRVEEAS